MALHQEAEHGLEARGWQLLLLCSTVCLLSCLLWAIWAISSCPTACPLQKCPQEWPWILPSSDPGVCMCWFSMCSLKGMHSPGSHSFYMGAATLEPLKSLWNSLSATEFTVCGTPAGVRQLKKQKSCNGVKINPGRSSRVSAETFLLGVKSTRGKAVSERTMQWGTSQKLALFRANRNRAESKALKSVERVPLIPVVYEAGTCGFGWRNVSIQSAV